MAASSSSQDSPAAEDWKQKALGMLAKSGITTEAELSQFMTSSVPNVALGSGAVGKAIHPGLGHELWSSLKSLSADEMASASDFTLPFLGIRGAHTSKESAAAVVKSWCESTHLNRNPRRAGVRNMDIKNPEKPVFKLDMDNQRWTWQQEQQTMFVPVQDNGFYANGDIVSDAAHELERFHGTRDSMLPLILRSGLKSSGLSHQAVSGLFC